MYVYRYSVWENITLKLEINYVRSVDCNFDLSGPKFHISYCNYLKNYMYTYDIKSMHMLH